MPGFALVLFLHNLTTIFWVGGMVTLAFTVIPAARSVLGMGPEMKRLLDAIQRRLALFTYVSFAVLVVTGLLLSRHSPAFHGLFRFGTPAETVLAIKHGLVIVMIAIALVRSRLLGRGAAAGGNPQGRERLKAMLLFVNTFIGIVVVLLSSLFSVLAG